MNVNMDTAANNPPHETDAIAFLNRWLTQRGHSGYQLSPLAGDASPRRYYRARTADGQNSILMDARDEREHIEPFLLARDDLSKAGLRVPSLLAADPAGGVLWLEDLGTLSFLDHLHSLAPPLPESLPIDDPVVELYRRAIDEILTIQAIDPSRLPPFDRELLSAEMSLFRDWFLPRELAQPPFTPEDEQHWRQLTSLLVENAQSQPQVWVHRDYHSRNLMLPAGEQRPALLDFQDAVRGPALYDLTSLLRDYYALLSQAQFDLLRKHFFSLSPLTKQSSPAELTRQFDLLSAQRHLKVIGIFARLSHRDNKNAYLADIPRAWHYLRAITSTYDELRWLDTLINSEPFRQWVDRTESAS